MANDWNGTSWILIGGTGQEFGLTAATLSLLGVVPAPQRCVLIDADGKGELYKSLADALDLVRYARFAGAGAEDPLLRIVPLEPIAHRREHTLDAAFGEDPHLQALYASTRRQLDTSDGFKAEPQLGSASFFKPAFDPKSPFRMTLQQLSQLGSHLVCIVGSVAGGTGSGLWQLVARLVRQLLPSARIRLILMGPSLSVQPKDGQAHELDADGNPLTDARLDANAAAGFRAALEAAGLQNRPFDDLYLLGYPAALTKPTAPPDRTALRTSRLPLVAASALTHPAPPAPAGQSEGAWLFADDVGELSTMSGLVFRPGVNGGPQIPGTDIGVLAASTARLLGDLRKTSFSKGRWVFSPTRALSAPIRALLDGAEVKADTWKAELDELIGKAEGLLGRFDSWLADPTDQYPGQIASSNKDLFSVQRVKDWQDAVDHAGSNATDAKLRQYHQRRILCAVGRAHLFEGRRIEQPEATPTWLVPADSTTQASRVGWDRVQPDNIHVGFVHRAESYPTPFAQAHWNTQNLRLENPAGAQARHATATLGEAAALWRALVAGLIEVVWEKVPPLDLNRGADVIRLRDVCAFIESGQFTVDGAGYTAIPFLRLTADLEGRRAGELVGAVHPLSGPFLGPDHRHLAAQLQNVMETKAQVVDGLLAAWASALASELQDSRHHRPAWLASVPRDAPAIDPRTVWSGEADLGLAWPLPSLAPIPVLGRTPRALRLVNHVDGGGPESVRLSVLPAYALADAEALYLDHRAASQVAFTDPSPNADGSLTFAGLPGADAAVTVVAEFDDVADWNIEVFPGNEAPAEWKEFGVAVEPATLTDFQDYEVVIYVDMGDGGSLRRVQVSDPGGDGWTPQFWLRGRPRILAISKPTSGTVGFFSLLGPAASRRNPSQRAQLGLDLGTSRSFVVAKADGIRGGAPFSVTVEQVVEALPRFNEFVGQYQHWHPLRSLRDGGGLGALDYANDPVLRASRVLMLPSTLVSRMNGRTESCKPFADYTIAGDQALPQHGHQFEVVNDVKWSSNQDHLQQFLTLVLLTSVAQLDSAVAQPPTGIDLRMSFPLAFNYQQRGRLQTAVTAACAEVHDATGVTLAPSYLDESLAGMFKAGLGTAPWKLSIDIGGGSVDMALLFGTQSIATDSVRIGGELVMRRFAREHIQASNLDEAVYRLRSDLRAQRFDAYFGFQAPPRSMELLALVEEYAARLVAGVFVNLKRDLRPPTVEAGVFEEMKKAVGSTVDVTLFLFGGGWRLGSLVHQLGWTSQFAAQIGSRITQPIMDRVNALLVDAKAGAQVTLHTQFSSMEHPGGEKAVVALGLFEPAAEGLRQGQLPVVRGIQTINGLDEDFEGARRGWHEWVGPEISWRTSTKPVHGNYASQPQGTPAFASRSLTDAAWQLDNVQRQQKVAAELTPGHSVQSYSPQDLSRRVRSALSVAYEVFYGDKIETGG